jgi:hypothetical protein
MATDETSGAVAWTNLFVTNLRIDGGAEATIATHDRCVRGASPVVVSQNFSPTTNEIVLDGNGPNTILASTKREYCVPDDLIQFWLGHAGKSMTDND